MMIMTFRIVRPPVGRRKPQENRKQNDDSPPSLSYENLLERVANLERLMELRAKEDMLKKNWLRG